MADMKSVPWVFSSLFFAALVCASPAMAQLRSPQEASQHIDELAKQVYVPGNAAKANEDLNEFCKQVGEKLRGFERKEWEAVAAKCGQAKRTMEDYNSGGPKRSLSKRHPSD